MGPEGFRIQRTTRASRAGLVGAGFVLIALVSLPAWGGSSTMRILVEFIALLVLGSQGRTRIFGTIVIGTLITAEFITIGGPVVGVDVADIKLRWLLPFVWLLLVRIRAEEALLASEFGDRYADYRRRTWRLVPWVY